MSRSVLHSRNVGHRQLWRSLGGYTQSGQFAEECARSESTVKALSFLSDLRGHEGCVNVIVFNPSGDILASGSDDGKVRLWNPYTFTCMRTMNAHQSNVFAAEFLPFNDQHLASGGNDAELKYYNLETEEATIYSHHTRKVLRMTVHPEHPYCFMSCSADGTVRMIDTRQHYDASSSGPIETVQGRVGDVVPQALGGGRGMRPAGATPATASLIVNYRTRHAAPQLYSVDFNPMNGQQFIVGSERGDIRLFDLRQIREHSPCSYLNIYTNKVGGVDDITGCVFSRDGRTIVGTALSDAIYTWKTEDNFEKNHEFPLCLKGGAMKREPCDHSAHTYTAPMVTRFHEWETSRAHQRRRAGGGMFGAPGDLDDDEDDEDDDDDELSGSNEDDGGPSNDRSDDAAGEEDEEEEEELSHSNMDVSGHSEDVGGNHADGDENGANGDDHDGDDAGEGGGAAQRQRRGVVMPNLRDLLGAWPILTGEGGAITIDIETFLRVAANVTGERHHHRHRRQRAAPAQPQQQQQQQQATHATDETETESKTGETSNSMDVTSSSPEASSSTTAATDSSSSLGSAKKGAESSPLGPLQASSSETGESIHRSSADLSSSAPSVNQSGSSESTQDALDKTKEKKEEPKPIELPQTYLHRFTGHASVQTIKGVNFWGPNSEFVVSGSDDANVFIWDAETAELLNILVGHDDVVNCVVGHPRLPIIATSGIDDIIKLWEPIGPCPTPETIKNRIRDITGANANNRRFDRGIQCAQQ